MSRLFHFLSHRQFGWKNDGDSTSFVASDEPDFAEQSLGLLSDEEYETGENTNDVSLRRDGAVRNVHVSRKDMYERLDLIKLARRTAYEKGSRGKQNLIRFFLMLWGILHLIGSKR